MRTSTGFCVGLLIVSLTTPLSAQRTDSTTHAHARARPAMRTVRIAKWTTLVAGAVTAAYGFNTNRKADNGYKDIESICKATPLRCLAHNADGTYSDATLERMYQDVRSLDHRSRFALIGGQATLAASVVLFIIDLREARAPANVPYNPRKLTVVPSLRGLELKLAVP